jgi:CBS domain-containing protein
MAPDISPPRTTLAPPSHPPVAQVMHPAVTTVESGAHLAAAAYLMRHRRSNALVVTSDDENHRPLAVLTDSDITQAVADGSNLEATRIRDLTDRPLLTVDASTTVDSAARSMLLHRIHHLPVVDGGRLVGIVDMADVCRALLPPDEETDS